MFFFFLLLLLGFIACEKDNNSQSLNDLPQEFLHFSMGAVTINGNVSDYFEDFELFVENDSTITSRIIDSINGSYVDITILGFDRISDRYLALGTKANEDIDLYVFNNFAITTMATSSYSGTDLDVSINALNFSFDLTNSGPPSAGVADCTGLGPRCKDETFGGCFERNWNNFCDGFASCVTQITSPHLVAVAITGVCLAT